MTELGSAFVRIRPDLTGFRAEAQAGIKSAFREVGTLHVPGLGSLRQEFASVVAPAREAGAAASASIRQIRTAREQQVRDSVAASLRERRALQQEVLAYRALAVDARASAAARIEANRLAAASAQRLGLELTHLERRSIAGAAGLAQVERGAIAGSGAMRGMGRNVAFASLSFIGAYGFANAVRSSIEAANDLNTQAVRSETVFGRSGRAVRQWARDNTRELGFSRESVLGVANSFGTLLRSVELLPRVSAQFSEDFTRVAAAISLGAGEADPGRATSALRGALLGRGRLLKQYGIVLDETVLKAKAAELGLLRTTADPAKIVADQRKLVEANIALNEARAKGDSPLRVAKAEDALGSAQQQLKRDLAGTTAELSKQEQAIAAHAAVMEQGQHFVDRYGESLETGAGRSRRFHEGVSEIKEELGTALYPTFAQVTDGIVGYIHEISEGGPRHAEFRKDLRDLGHAADVLYGALRHVGQGLQGISDLVGGYGNLVEILGFAFLANKALVLAHNIRTSRLALVLLGAQAPVTAASVVAAEAEMTAGATGLAGALGLAKTRFIALGKLAAVTLVIDLIVNKKDRDTVKDVFAHPLRHSIIFQSLFGSEKRDDPRKRVDQLRKENFSEEAIYHALRGEGYSRKLVVDAILATREKPFSTGDAFRPSPEDVRFLDDGSRAAGGTTRKPAKLIRAELAALAKEIESGEKITTARAKVLSEALAGVMAEIAEGGFGVERRRQLTGRVEQLATELADAAAGIGAGTVKALRKDRADIREELRSIGEDIAEARVEMARAVSEAIQNAAAAERDAVAQAKANLNTLGQSLADFVNRFVDAQDERNTEAPSGPLAARLKRLTELIHAGKGTPELIAEAEKVEHELNQQASKTGEDAQKRKDRINRGLADLTAQLNTGKISLAKFNREVTRLLAREGVSYKAAGKTLGVAFADGFRVALKELREQAAALLATPANLRRRGTGFETQVIRPLQVIREQNANIAQVERDQHKQLRELVRRRHELLLKEQQDSNKLARIQRARLIELAKLRDAGKPPAAERKPDRDRDTGRRDHPERRQGPQPGVAGHGPDPLGAPRRTEQVREVQSAKLRVDVQADRARARGELERLASFFRRRHLTLGLRLEREPGDQQRALAAAKRGGAGIGGALSDGIELGLRENLDEIGDAAARTIRQVIRAAKRAAKIGSPSQLTYDEIGVPLSQGITRAITDERTALGDALAAHLREAILRGERVARERHGGAQRPTRTLRDASPRPTPQPGVAPALRGAEERAAVRERRDTVADSQRDLLLREGRIHTRLLGRIARADETQTTILREVEVNTRHGHPRRRTAEDKNPQRASREAVATATHNLLGS